jgi:hypothetical protein
MTQRASRAGARVVEIPITFRDRRVGQSKMSRRIVAEALVVVVRLRAEELLGRRRGARPAGTGAAQPGPAADTGPPPSTTPATDTGPSPAPAPPPAPAEPPTGEATGR